MSERFEAWSFCRDVVNRGSILAGEAERGGWGYEQLSSQMDAIASRFADRLKPHLATVPADDEEPITDAWLSSVAGEGPVVHRGYVIEIGPLEYEPRAEEVGGPVELHPYYPHSRKVLATRGDVRRVAAAVGESLKDDA